VSSEMFLLKNHQVDHDSNLLPTVTHRGTRYKIESMESPPPFLGAESFGRSKSTDLCSFAKPVQVNYSTQALSISQITVVKELDSVELHSINEDDESKSISKIATKLAGRGSVNVKRSVHGYKKLSLVHRQEISRSSIILPSMEFDTDAFWLDTDATTLREIVHNYDAGVHALSHAMVAVAPIFTPCTSADIDCDHSRFDCTRIVLYDSRVGGSGMSHALYDQLYEMLEAAVDLLHGCTSCSVQSKYEGGCPGCLQSIRCDNFQEDLSRPAAISIARYLLKRLKTCTASLCAVANNKGASKAKDVLIGRPSWMENSSSFAFAEVDE
jgi:DEAD/DEAH box helicase domain-containing protein